MKMPFKIWSLAFCLFFLASCGTTSIQQEEQNQENEKNFSLTVEKSHFQMLDWEKLPAASITPDFWQAFLKNCAFLKENHPFFNTCQAAQWVDAQHALDFFKSHCNLFQITDLNGNPKGLATGYYEPMIHASLKKSKQYPYPIYAPPDDLIAFENDKTMRYRWDSKTKKLLPYWSREEFLNLKNPKAKVLFWAKDAVELFFLQIQGSGTVLLENGKTVALNYANHNGWPYRSIGQYLVEIGQMTLDSASMPNIQQWVRQNHKRGMALLNKNPRYIFFKIRENKDHAVGAMGIPLTPKISVAVDKNIIPLGVPLFLKTTYPNSHEPLEHFVLTQDVGSAIQGAVRVDYFWGKGNDAGEKAGKMKQTAELFLIFPRNESLDFVLNQNLNQNLNKNLKQNFNESENKKQ